MKYEIENVRVWSVNAQRYTGQVLFRIRSGYDKNYDRAYVLFDQVPPSIGMFKSSRLDKIAYFFSANDARRVITMLVILES